MHTMTQTPNTAATIIPIITPCFIELMASAVSMIAALLSTKAVSFVD
jgi:hypothetical protein